MFRYVTYSITTHRWQAIREEYICEYITDVYSWSYSIDPPQKCYLQYDEFISMFCFVISHLARSVFQYTESKNEYGSNIQHFRQLCVIPFTFYNSCCCTCFNLNMSLCEENIMKQLPCDVAELNRMYIEGIFCHEIQKSDSVSIKRYLRSAERSKTSTELE